MIREFNYTQRQRLAAGQIRIELVAAPEGGPSSFNADLNLDGLPLPPAAPVVIEAYRRNAAMRFSWGTAGALQPPDNRELSAVDYPPNFRVMILDPDGSRRILALANRIAPQGSRDKAGGAQELVHLIEQDLGQEVWRLDFGEPDDLPRLEVNQSIDGISHAVRHDPALRALIFPEVMRAILTHALLVAGADPTHTDGFWHSWFGFVSQFHRPECPTAAGFDPESEEYRKALTQWIDDAVQAFAAARFFARDHYALARR